MPRPILLIDTREKRPYRLPNSRRAALRVGDYSVAALESKVAVERKSLADFFHSFTRTRARMFDRLDEMASLAYPLLVVEARPSQVIAGSDRTRVSGRALLRTVAAACAERGVQLQMVGTRREARTLTLEWLLGAHAALTSRVASASRDSSFAARRTRVYSG